MIRAQRCAAREISTLGRDFPNHRRRPSQIHQIVESAAIGYSLGLLRTELPMTPLDRRHFLLDSLAKPLACALAVLALAPACARRKPASQGDSKTTATGASVNSQAASSGRVKIVSSLPRTGSANAQTTTMVNGIKLAIDEVGGKVGGFEVAYEDWDDASAKKGDWDPEVEAANADKAVKDADVMFYIGTYNSGAAKISMPVLNKASVVMISPANSYTGLTKPGMGEPSEPGVYRPTGKINYFRVVPADDIQGRVAVEWMQQMGAKTAYILDDRGLYGKGIADVFEQTAKAKGLEILGREGIDPKAQEYRSLMTKIKAKNPDFVYFGGTTQSNAGQIAKDIVAVGLAAKVMLPDGCFEKAFIEAAGAPNANGRAYVTFGGVPPEQLTGKGAEFVKKYRERFKAEPEGYAVYGYVAAKSALDVLAQVGKKDRESLRLAMANYGQKAGALGTWHFDANGDTSMTTMSGNIVDNGEFKFATKLGGTAGEAADAAAPPSAGSSGAAAEQGVGFGPSARLYFDGRGKNPADVAAWQCVPAGEPAPAAVPASATPTAP